MKKSIAIIFGGCSSEYKVSLASSYAAIKNLDSEKYEKHLIGISEEGNWYLFDGDISLIKEDRWQENCNKRVVISTDREYKGLWAFQDNLQKEDSGKLTTETTFIPLDYVLPVLHGKNGEDGTIQGLVEMAGVPIVGCSMEPSVLCMDKYLAHRVARDAGIRTPDNILLRSWEEGREKIDTIRALGFPLFVKPLKAGSSLGITKVHEESEMLPAIEEAFRWDDCVICEANIDGFEVGCAVIGDDEVLVSPVDEIELFVDWFDYEEKYSQYKSKIHMPARISDEMAEKVRETAGKIYRALGCDSFARVDIFIDKDDNIIFNEANTIPGLTDVSRFPSMARAMGIEYGKFLDMIIDLAGNRKVR